jgi:hypothetical protein
MGMDVDGTGQAVLMGISFRSVEPPSSHSVGPY